VVVVYLDDILVFTKLYRSTGKWSARYSMLENITSSLNRRSAISKQSSVEYLGVVIFSNSVKMDPAKIAGVAEWPIPTTKRKSNHSWDYKILRRFIEGSRIMPTLFT